MTMTATRLLLLAALIASASPDSGAQVDFAAATGVDIHILFVESSGGNRSEWGGIPEVRLEAIHRFAGTRGQMAETASYGRTPKIIKRLSLHRNGNRGFSLRREIKTRRFSSSGSASLRTDGFGDVQSIDDQFVGQMSFRRGWAPGYTFLLFVPWKEEPATIEPWTPTAYATWLAELCMEIGSLDSAAGRALMRMPLQSLLEAPTLAKLRNWTDAWEPRPSRGRMSGRYIVDPRDIKTGVRLASGDPAALEDLRSRGHRWALGPAIILAYAQSGDPEHKGELGWLLVNPNSDLHRRGLIAPYFEAVEAGEVIIPGTPDERSRRHAALASLVAETNASGSLLVLIAAGGAMIGFALLARRAALKLAI